MISRPTLISFCRLIGCPTEPGATLFQVLWALTKYCKEPTPTDEETFTFIHLRVAAGEALRPAGEALLEVHEAADIMDYQDRRQLIEEQKTSGALG